jgi:hypothetical protein
MSTRMRTRVPRTQRPVSMRWGRVNDSGCFDDTPDVMYIPSNTPLGRQLPHLPPLGTPGHSGFGTRGLLHLPRCRV